MDIVIRKAEAGDAYGIWAALAPVFTAGETYAVPRDWDRETALAYWLAPEKTSFVAVLGGQVAGTYYLRANRPGPGAHVANAGFMVSDKAGGKGVGQAMCEHALVTAKARAFTAMQFNFVVAAYDRAVRLWQRMGFAEIGCAPDAFQHPHLGLADALVMYRKL